jgi:hypothetical protein
MLKITPVRMSHAGNRKIKAIDVKRAIQHAQNICFNFENTPECRSAWEVVDELTEALDTQIQRPKKEPERSEMSKRDYEI